MNPKDATKVDDLPPIIIAATIAALKETFPNLGIVLILSDPEKAVSGSSLPPKVMGKMVKELSERIALANEETTPNALHH